MRKKISKYDTAVDALVAVTKRLTSYEERYRMISEEFFDGYTKGKLDDTEDYVEWANDYKHYMALKLEVERSIRHVA
jgi:hypothetical protein